MRFTGLSTERLAALETAWGDFMVDAARQVESMVDAGWAPEDALGAVRNDYCAYVVAHVRDAIDLGAALAEVVL